MEKVKICQNIDKTKLILSICFIIAEITMLCLILFFLKNKAHAIVSFTCIALAFMFSFVFYSTKNRSLLTNGALLFTVLADIFLVLTYTQNKELAMSFFLVTQLLYFVRILYSSTNEKQNLIHIILRSILTILIIIITSIVLRAKTDYLSIISMIYYTNLILNVTFAFINFKHSPLLAFGLLCFLICDTFIGFEVATGLNYFSISSESLIYKIVHSSFNFAWFFYVPAQTMLSLSTKDKLNQKVLLSYFKRTYNNN